MSVETDAMDGAVPDLEEGRTPEPGEEPAEGTLEEEEEIPPTVVEGEPVAIEPGLPLAGQGQGHRGAPGRLETLTVGSTEHCDHEQPEIVARTKGVSRHAGTRLVRWCPACGAIRVGSESPWRTPGSWGT